MEILLRAAKGESITLTFPDTKKAHTFRRRLYTLRARVAEQDEEKYKVICRAEVGPVTQEGAAIGHGMAPATVTLRLKDSEFTEIIKNAKTETGVPLSAPTVPDVLEDLPLTEEQG